MRLPLIKHLTEFVEEKDPDFLLEAIETLEFLTESSSVKDEELDVIGELLSNMYGAIEVNQKMLDGASKREALNDFMGRVLSSIDQ